MPARKQPGVFSTCPQGGGACRLVGRGETGQPPALRPRADVGSVSLCLPDSSLWLTETEEERGRERHRETEEEKETDGQTEKADGEDRRESKREREKLSLTQSRGEEWREAEGRERVSLPCWAAGLERGLGLGKGCLQKQ